jgi:uncharacterized protein YjiS (DUF1127 family)
VLASKEIDAMTSHTHPLHTHTTTRVLGTIVAHLTSAPGAVFAYLTAASRRAARRRELHQLSEEALRDIGLHRSEIDSCWAESEGLAQATRLRLMCGPWR